MLTKIHKAEALFSQDFEPVDIEVFSSEILNAVRYKHYKNSKKFEVKTEKVGSVILNKKLFTSLLLNLCKSSEKIEISSFAGNILMKAYRTNLQEHKKLIEALGGTYFFMHHTNTVAILISAKKTDKTPKSEIKDWEYLLNPLSVVNIYLS